MPPNYKISLFKEKKISKENKDFYGATDWKVFSRLRDKIC